MASMVLHGSDMIDVYLCTHVCTYLLRTESIKVSAYQPTCTLSSPLSTMYVLYMYVVSLKHSMSIGVCFSDFTLIGVTHLHSIHSAPSIA